MKNKMMDNLSIDYTDGVIRNGGTNSAFVNIESEMGLSFALSLSRFRL
jgi:hypothetical protein